MEGEYQEIDLKEIMQAILAKWWIIALLTISIASLGYYVTSNHMTPIYQADTILFIGKEQSGLGEIGVSLNDLYTNDQLFLDYQQLASTRLVIEEVNKNLNINIPIEDFKRSMGVYAIERSRLFGVSYSSTNPQLATDVSNELATQITLAAAKVVNVQNIRIVDKAIIPVNPISPNLTMNTIIAGFLGLVFALLIIFIHTYMDNTVKKDEDIEKLIKLPVIGVIPEFKGEVRK
ncbi:MAG: hypothetical protein CVV02_08760 [Firmicutes bacterium HGW-Firmicutes-7]|nr:MAG: hypothetical protein CVV02_08760 [Firmicutes bacterium HGW-Firmicutes-7]